MARSRTENKPKRELQVLALGLPRTGSASIAEALTILGYKDVYHGLNVLDSPEDWSLLGSAADASFSILPTYTGKPFKRKQWDELFGPCEAVTDLAAIFATQLIEVYPEAKVILVIRNFDTWFRSIEGGIRLVWSFPFQLAFNHLRPFVNPVFGEAINKIIEGFFEAKSIGELRQKARMVYDRHHREIRKLVPPNRLLEYRMGQGWEPICNFLNKPQPNIVFPRLNDAKALRMRLKRKMRSQFVAAGIVLVPWIAGSLAVLLGGWMMARGLGIRMLTKVTVPAIG
ncbi:hypothetical protein HIM_11507 [Hirsutella minnesotensis 3608]|uniref:Uncharacterized protein n=1 Tax=Hirsutella minnesotensis 3608 TaxID=1043627 RepID=A0A0F7ZJ00_9HYPO|nr:hypothetical protein HIM_11507 [Hirsutella minnesotensis 3608]